jgi:hypothetical protein
MIAPAAPGIKAGARPARIAEPGRPTTGAGGGRILAPIRAIRPIVI